MYNIFKIEIIDEQENLIDEFVYNNKIDMMIKYDKIKNSLIQKKLYRGYIIELFKGYNIDNLEEIKKYRIQL